MERRVYRSVEDMTRPETLSTLLERPITTARLVPFQTVGWSSTESEFSAVETDDTDHARYVVKRMVRDRDWVMQSTEDDHWRAIAIWQHGLLDRLPAEINDVTIACAVDGIGCALLMRDISHALVPDTTPLSVADNAFVLDAMAALHVAFWDDAVLSDPALHLCRPRHLFTFSAPEKIQRMPAGCSSRVLTMILEGWHVLPTLVEADIAGLLCALACDPRPLCTALARYPRTLVHGDWRLANFGIEHGDHPRLILLDWACPTPTVPAHDLAYYVVTSAHQLPISREAAIALYKQRLAHRLGARFDEAWWQPQLELSLLAAFVRMGCFKAWFVVHAADESRRTQRRADLEWLSDKARAWASWLA